MKTEGLTKNQIRILEFIDESIRLHGLSPTLDEIRKYIGSISKSGIHYSLRCLRDRNRIRWIPGCNRSIVIVPDDRATHILPPDLQAKLEKYCADHNENAGDVLADALVLHFDQLEATGTVELLSAPG